MEEKKSENSQKLLFQIPSMEGKPSQNFVIGVIDCSGSMSSYWEWLANVWNESLKQEQIYKIITFDTSTKLVPEMKLSTNINKHGGGGTNISKAFVQFEKELEELPTTASVTCIFISDGQDNNLGTLEKRMSELRGNMGRLVNFICLGVESGFPTFLSMNLRKLYHNGDEGIPPLYLIEYASEKAFFNKFQTILPFLKGGNLLDVIPPCRLYPWEEPKTELYEGSWVITEENYVCINDQKIEVDSKKVGISDLVEIIRSWLQNLHLICLKDDKAGIVNAKLTLPEIHNQLDIYAKNTGIDLRVLEAKDNFSFFDSALGLFMKNVGQRVNWFIEEIEKLAKGDNPKNLCEFEAAKRIQLGTITGKHQQKALALKNIPIDEFKQIKNSFIEIFKQTKIQAKETENDVFPYCSQKMRKLFLQDKFINAFEYCTSQYDLFDALSLPGISLNIKRNNGFEANPWLMQVKNVKLSNKTTDSAKIITNSYLLSLAIPDSEEKEEVNCCLPLFTADDSDLMPLFSHQLMQMVINHLITMNADAYFEDAYYSLLAHTYLAMVSDQQKADFYPEIKTALFQSFEMFYQDKVQQFAEQLENKPQEFFQEKSKNSVYNCSISKAFFLIAHLSKKKTTPIESLKKMFDNLLLQWCSEFMKENKYLSTSFFVENFDEAKIMEESRNVFDKALYLSSFKKLFSDIITKLSTGSYGMNYKALDNFNSEIELRILKGFSSQELNEEISKDVYILNLYHCIKYQDQIFTEKKSQSLEEANKFLADKTINANKPKTKGKKKKKDSVFSLSIACESYKKLSVEYTQKFIENHSEVIPFSKEEIKEECKARNIDFNLIEFSQSNLPSNLCLSKSCPFYFKVLPKTKDTVQTSLKKHMDNWQGLKPQSFHAIVKENVAKNVEEIYEILKNKVGFTEDKFKVSKEFTMKYIEKVRMKYADIKD